MSRLLVAALLSLGPAAALAQAPSEGELHAAPPTECPTALTEAADEQCELYWQNNINWVSWDYRAVPDQKPEHRHMAPPLLFAFINFAVFGWIMWKLAARPLADFVRARHTTIRKDLDAASALHREAEARLADYSAKIAGLDREIDTLLAQVRADAELEKARIIEEAQKQAVRLKQDAEAQIQMELRRLRAELKAEAVNAAIGAAEQILATRATPEDQTRLADRFVAEVERTVQS